MYYSTIPGHVYINIEMRLWVFLIFRLSIFVLIVRLLPSLVDCPENFKTKFCTIKYW